MGTHYLLIACGIVYRCRCIHIQIYAYTYTYSYTYTYASLRGETSVSHGMEETFQRRMKDGASPWWLRKISMDGEGCEAPGGGPR